MTDPLQPSYWVSLVVSTFIMGFAIKYVDAAYQDNIFNKISAIVAAICSALFMAFWIATDSSAAVFLLAICISVAISRKISNPAFVLGILIVLFLPTFMMKTITITWLPFACLVLAGVVDHELRTARNLPFKGMRMFFHYRMSMLIMMAALTAFGFFDWPYLLAFLSLGLGYELVDYYVGKKTNAQQSLD